MLNSTPYIYNILNSTQFCVALAFFIFIAFCVKYIKVAVNNTLNDRVIKLTDKFKRSLELKNEANSIYLEISKKFNEQQDANKKSLVDSTKNISNIINKMLKEHTLDLEYKLKEFSNKMELNKTLVLQRLNNEFVSKSFALAKNDISNHILNHNNDLEIAESLLN